MTGVFTVVESVAELVFEGGDTTAELHEVVAIADVLVVDAGDAKRDELRDAEDDVAGALGAVKLKPDGGADGDDGEGADDDGVDDEFVLGVLDGVFESPALTEDCFAMLVDSTTRDASWGFDGFFSDALDEFFNHLIVAFSTRGRRNFGVYCKFFRDGRLD